MPDDFDRMGEEVINPIERDALSVDSQRMKTLAVTAARRRFGSMLDLALGEPVLITRKNKKGAVIISAAEYDRLTKRGILDQRQAKQKGN